MTYEKRLKGTRRWREITPEEARDLCGPRLWLVLLQGWEVDVPTAIVRQRAEQPNLPGIGEGAPGAYGRG